jgi:hypothetical protein
MKKGDYVLVTKVVDEVFNGVHPNGIDVGYQSQGTLQRDLKEGDFLHIVGFGRYLITSTIQKILDENTFTTMNSTYKIKKIDPPKELSDEFGLTVQFYDI